MKKAIGGLLILCFVIIMSKCNPSTVRNTPLSDTSVVDTSSTDTSVVDTSSTNTNAMTKENEAYKWVYSEQEDKMTSRKTYFATMNSPTDLNFASPYDGATAGITIRKKRGSLDVLLQITKGQFITHYDGTTIRARFDKEPATTYSCSEASDNSSNVLFINNASKFLSKLKSHKKLVIEAEFYQEGLKQIEFDISNLEWKH